jgi:hypothetical protein
MDDVTPISERDPKTGQFLVGHIGYGGRKPGSSNLLSTQFKNDVYAAWQKHGPQVLERCAIEDPVAFARLVASMLPTKSEVDVSVSQFHDATSIVECFRMMSAAVNGDSERVIQGLRKHVPHLLGHADD